MSGSKTPVQTQMSVSALKCTLSSEHPVKNNSEVRPWWKRVFVQTDAGCVMGIELDREDSVHTVKRKLQVALNIPTEESSLIYGDKVLKNDLSTIRNDSHLLLARNGIHRSSSTPCLSPNSHDLRVRDHSGLIEVLACAGRCVQTNHLVKEVARAIRNGVEPVFVNNGLGGAYYFKNSKGERAAIVKPNDEEPFAPNNPKGFTGKSLGQPGLKRSVRVGETGYREVAAYLLDYNNFANIPPTVLVKISHSIFHVNENVGSCVRKFCGDTQVVTKIASLQQFMSHDFDASDYGSSSFPVSAVHRIGILDIRIFNTDRHAGNILVKKLDMGSGRFRYQTDLIPIDHGLCLPESLEDPYFEWIHWPQSSIPFSEDELQYIADLDPVKDSEMLRMELPMIREACLRVLVLSTIFLKEAASFGLCLAEIGQMMSREFSGKEEQPSQLEIICIEARKLALEHDVLFLENDSGDEDPFQFEIEHEDEQFIYKAAPSYPAELKGGSNRNLLQKDVEEKNGSQNDGNMNAKKETIPQLVRRRLPSASALSSSLNRIGLGEKSAHRTIPKNSESVRTTKNSSTHMQGANWRSANEQLPTSASFVKVADLSDETWRLFLEKFQELLPAAFRSQKCGAVSQRQRMGTSCQF